MVRLASHTRNHVVLPDTPLEDLEAEIGGSKQDIEQYGVPCDVMIYPKGQSNDVVISVVRKYFRFGFAAGGPVDKNGLPTTTRINYSPLDTYRMVRLSIDGTWSDEEMALAKQMVDETCANNGVLIFMSHIGSTNGAYNGASAADDLLVYTEIVEYIRSKGYAIEPVIDICNRFENIIEVGHWSSASPQEFFSWCRWLPPGRPF